MRRRKIPRARFGKGRNRCNRCRGNNNGIFYRAYRKRNQPTLSLAENRPPPDHRFKSKTAWKLQRRNNNRCSHPSIKSVDCYPSITRRPRARPRRVPRRRLPSPRRHPPCPRRRSQLPCRDRESRRARLPVMTGVSISSLPMRTEARRCSYKSRPPRHPVYLPPPRPPPRFPPLSFSRMEVSFPRRRYQRPIPPVTSFSVESSRMKPTKERLRLPRSTPNSNSCCFPRRRGRRTSSKLS